MICIDWFYLCVVVYCGGGMFVLENMLVVFDEGVWCGYWMVEFDVKLLVDDVIFLLYDDMVDWILNGYGVVVGMCYVVLVVFDVGVWCDVCFVGEWMLMFEVVVVCCIVYGLVVNVEIKLCLGCECEIGQCVVVDVVVYWCDVVVVLLLLLFLFDVLWQVCVMVLVLLCGMFYEVVLDDWYVQVIDVFDCVLLYVDYIWFDEFLVCVIKVVGLCILVYMVNDFEWVCELVCWGVDVVCMDCIDLIVFDVLDDIDVV